MSKKEDQRIVKTKEKLSNTLISLLKQKPMSDIKISELCTAAEISRATFYNNFNSIDEVFAYYITSIEFPLEENVIAQMSAVTNPTREQLPLMFKAYIFPVIEALEKKRDDLQDVLETQSASGDFYMAVNNYIKSLCSRLLAGYGAIMNVQVPDDVAIAYSAGAIGSLIMHLLQCGDKYTLEEKQHFVYHLVYEKDDYFYQHHPKTSE